MEMKQTDVAADVLGISLHGRLDTPGVDDVETAFTDTATRAGRHVLVDLSDVEFVGSMGLRMFISVAKALSKKKSKLVLYGARPLVKDVFDTVSLGDIVPVADDADAARRAARG